MKNAGIVIIVIGILMIVFTSVNFKTNKKIADIGPVEVHKKENRHIGWPAYTGALVCIVGVVIFLAGRKS